MDHYRDCGDAPSFYSTWYYPGGWPTYITSMASGNRDNQGSEFNGYNYTSYDWNDNDFSKKRLFTTTGLTFRTNIQYRYLKTNVNGKPLIARDICTVNSNGYYR